MYFKVHFVHIEWVTDHCNVTILIHMSRLHFTIRNQSRVQNTLVKPYLNLERVAEWKYFFWSQDRERPPTYKFHLTRAWTEGGRCHHNACGQADAVKTNSFCLCWDTTEIPTITRVRKQRQWPTPPTLLVSARSIQASISPLLTHTICPAETQG